MADLIQTCDPYVWIEARQINAQGQQTYVLYRMVTEPNNSAAAVTRRWEVSGICDGNGSCWVGADNPRPSLDCPVTPELSCECRSKATDPLSFNELGLSP